MAALVIGFSPMASPMAAVAAPSAELQLTDFESESLVVDGLKNAGLEGDLKMMKLWARLKAGALEVEGREAAGKVSEEKALASARMRVRSVQPYLDEAQRDIFAGRWKYVAGYVGVIFSQVEAFQTVTVETYPGSDQVSLASKDALVTEGNNVIKNAQSLAAAAKARSEPKALAAYAKLSLSYDRFLKAGDLYGNSLILPSGPRPKPKPKAAVSAPSEDVLTAKRAYVAATAKEAAADRAAGLADADVDAKEAAAKKAAAAARAAITAADRAEMASEKADLAVRNAAAERAAAEKAARADAAAKAGDELSAAKAVAEARERAEQEAEAAEAAALKVAAEKKAGLEAAEARLKAASESEAAAKKDVKLYEKAVAYEEKQDAAARKLASQKDTSSAIVPQYDPLTSTESLYKNTPQSALQYDLKAKPKLKDRIVVVAGPDKGRVGTLLGIEDGTCIVKLSTKELKVIDIEKIGKSLDP